MLTEDEEAGLCQWISIKYTLDLSPRREHVADAANRILDHRPREPDESAPKVGSNWVKNFLQRHPELCVRRQQTPDISRKQARDATPEEEEEYLGNPSLLTPKTVRQFDALCTHIFHLEAGSAEQSEAIRKLVKGAKAQCTVTQLLEADLAKIETARATPERRSRSQRILKQSGAIHVGTARSMVRNQVALQGRDALNKMIPEYNKVMVELKRYWRARGKKAQRSKKFTKLPEIDGMEAREETTQVSSHS